MSLKTILQFFIILLIVLIIGAVYFKYFEKNRKVIEEINTLENSNSNQLEELEKKISNLELKNQELVEKIENNKNKTVTKSETTFNKKEEAKIDGKNENNFKKEMSLDSKKTNDKTKEEIKEKPQITKKKIVNLVKNVEYTSVDQKGNRFNLLAKSGKSNIDNKDVLELEDVKGEIKSDNRDTIYIVSDYAKYNSSNLNSKFYKNVIINYQDKKITCSNFDINMEKNMAIAYNDVVITDPKSILKAGIVEFDLKTKDININPQSTSTEVEVIIN